MSSDPRRVPVIPPREPKVPLSKLVSCFRGIYDALAARDAHLDGESAAAKRKRLDNIGHLRFAFQHWINSWWNGHLFRVDLRLRLDPPYEPPFTDNPALLRNFCTWWLLSSGDQEILRNYLERLVQRIQSGDFDEESALVRACSTCQLQLFNIAWPYVCSRPSKSLRASSGSTSRPTVRKGLRTTSLLACEAIPCEKRKRGASHVMSHTLALQSLTDQALLLSVRPV